MSNFIEMDAIRFVGHADRRAVTKNVTFLVRMIENGKPCRDVYTVATLSIERIISMIHKRA
jgi:hypothetical protein